MRLPQVHHLLAPALLTGAVALVAPACKSSEMSSTQPPTMAAPPPVGSLESSVKPGLNDRFLDPDLDVEEMTATFEGESREIATSRDAIATQLALEPGTRIADIGAGTGLFLETFAALVGESGRVYAVDISPNFIQHLRARAARSGLPQVNVVQCTDRSATLGAAAVDVAFVCDTYHHFEYPQSTLASLFYSIRPGGKLFVIDFERIPGKTRDWVFDHVRAGKQEFRAEIETAGFVFEEEIEVNGLEENYLLRFRRP